jgi:DNA/RNA endonuclease G (NUC1)
MGNMRGDATIPTLFNGNFEADNEPNDFQRKQISRAIPGWSFHNGGDANLDLVNYLEDVKAIKGESEPDYALKLDNNLESVTHNRFVVPDWGALRFDLHVDNPDAASASQNSAVRVYLNGQELQSSAFQGLSTLERQANGNPNASDTEYPAVDLREFNPNVSAVNFNPKVAEGQSNRIGFAKQGFQTFQVDIPNEFRGKVATLKFEVDGQKTVYLDNVFFKSQHLLLGNPALNGKEARKDLDTPEFFTGYDPGEDIGSNPASNFSNNYLIEKPQYSLSYNDYLRTPNWVSYQLNSSWLGAENNRPTSFPEDPKLPFDNRAQDNDFTSNDYIRGHMARAADRSRNRQDYVATFLTSNVIPQRKNTNIRWGGLEGYLTNLTNNQNKEIYIVDGRNGQAVDNNNVPLRLNNKVSVPESIWKVALILEPGQGIADVTKDTLAFALYLPNTISYSESSIDDWKDNFTFDGKGFGLFNIRTLEEKTGYNFLSTIPTEIQDAIETRNVGDIKNQL